MNSGPPRNEELDLPEARIIDEDKEFVGVMSTDEAMVIAEEAGLDLVLVSPDANPPVCRIMNYSKFKYENEKKARETRKKAAAARVEVKELKMRYNIDVHDYGVRLRAAQKFLGAGDRVKVICQFRGRENEFRDIGRPSGEARPAAGASGRPERRRSVVGASAGISKARTREKSPGGRRTRRR